LGDSLGGSGGGCRQGKPYTRLIAPALRVQWAILKAARPHESVIGKLDDRCPSGIEAWEHTLGTLWVPAVAEGESSPERREASNEIIPSRERRNVGKENHQDNQIRSPSRSVLADRASTGESKESPVQIAAQILEEAPAGIAEP
jgi:hypothetical protein